MTEEIRTDVLIIGGGGAGCRAAIEAAENGVEVLLVDKGIFGSSGTTSIIERSAFRAAISNTIPKIQPQQHINEVMKAAAGVATKELIKTIAREAPERFRDLERWGVAFERADNGYRKVLGCFGKYQTANIVNGKTIIPCLQRQVEKRDIIIADEVMIVDLLINNGTISGAIGIDRDGDIKVIKAKSVVLSTGGAGQLYAHNCNPMEIAGDGQAMGLRAGALVANLEFIQIVFRIPTSSGSPIGLTSDIWSTHPEILNKNDQSFLQDYLPKNVSIEQCLNARSRHAPFSTSDEGMWLDIAVFEEIMAGRGSKNRGVFINLSDAFKKGISKREIAMADPLLALEMLLQKGLKIEKNLIEISCFQHVLNGGLVIKENCETTIPGLFAAGECVSGPHGADRPAGQMLAACQVLGAKAGFYGSVRAKEINHVKIDKNQVEGFIDIITKILAEKEGVESKEVNERIKTIMWENALIVRTDISLKKALKELIDIEKNYLIKNKSDTKCVFSILSTRNLLLFAQAILNSMLFRKESRGSHWRKDYPEKNDKMEGPIIMSMNPYSENASDKFRSISSI